MVSDAVGAALVDALALAGALALGPVVLVLDPPLLLQAAAAVAVVTARATAASARLLRMLSPEIERLDAMHFRKFR
jgi:hypothetical protein